MDTLLLVVVIGMGLCHWGLVVVTGAMSLASLFERDWFGVIACSIFCVFFFATALAVNYPQALSMY